MNQYKRQFIVPACDVHPSGDKIGPGTRKRCAVAVSKICAYLSKDPNNTATIFLAAGKTDRWVIRDTMAIGMEDFMRSGMKSKLNPSDKRFHFVVNNSNLSIQGMSQELLWIFNMINDEASALVKGEVKEKVPLWIVINAREARRVERTFNKYFPAVKIAGFHYSDETPPSWLHEGLEYLKLATSPVIK